MSNLFISFLIAIGGSLVLVMLSSKFDLEFYTSRIFPIIPIVYAFVYQFLEHAKNGKAKQKPGTPFRVREEPTAGAPAAFQNITAGRIAADVGVSFAIKILFEAIFTALFLYFSDQTFARLYGDFSFETIGRFLRGDHPWLTGSEGITLLILVALAASFGTGIWIGYTTRAKAILEGVITGAIVTLVNTITNMLILYRKIEEMANQMAASLGYATRIGFVAVITSQVLLYGLWSGVAQKAREERVARAALKKAAKMSRKKK